MLFNRYLADKILAGEKTQTRRSSERKRGARVYEAGDRVGIQMGYRSPVEYFIVKNRQKQAIGDVSEEDAKKEGFGNADEFKQFWVDRYGRWDPAQEVWVYDFVLEMKDLPSKDSNAGQEARRSESR